MDKRTTISGVDCVRALRKVGFRVKLVSERRTHLARGSDDLRIPRLPKLSDATLDLILLGACLSRDDLDALLDPEPHEGHAPNASQKAPSTSIRDATTMHAPPDRATSDQARTVRTRRSA